MKKLLLMGLLVVGSVGSWFCW